MWKLKHVKKEHIEKYLFVGEDFVVGRKDAALLITNDPSVSRRHAVLYIKHPEGNLNDPSKKSSLFLKDEGSKYGTFKNDHRINSEVELQNNDRIKFGQFESEYKIIHSPLVVTTSCLEISAKKDLRKIVHLFGGNFIAEWQPSCTHLVMTEIKVTVKALCCLVSIKPIVKPEYFQELKRSLNNSDSFLLPNQYIPPIGEALIDKDVVSFDINLQRKNLFKNKTFFFLDEKQFKKLHLGIILGGGSASILSKDDISPEILLRDGSCIIEPTQDMGSVLSSVRAILQKKEYRMIPESDIGLSVAYCSTDKFCNPQFNMVENLLSQKMQSQTMSQREVYVPDTQERSARSEKSRNLVGDALSSLHLSSFQNDPVEDMELSEVPLSAQIKRELDDLFDDPQEENNVQIPSKVDKPPSTSFSSISEKSTRQTKRTENQTDSPLPKKISPRIKKKNISHQDENILPNKIPKLEVNNEDENEITSVYEVHSPVKHTNGVTRKEPKYNLNSPKEDKTNTPLKSIIPVQTNGFHTEEAELPRNLAKIEFTSLICKKPAPVSRTNANSAVKNFKKFRKVHPKNFQALPRIIGAHDLVAFDKVAAELHNEMWDDPPEEEEPSQSVKGEFDW
ncbi:nibrin [Caerostris darwini]|uniref:Nibrin n=1 Tax=Caerostris darwini TaxID=1538125 RepID=A0AAV4S5L1_9ARAC|nr:nibrin [Caerostris darwini]